MLSIVDQRPHRMAWEVKLPSSNSRVGFPVRIDFEYQVEDVVQIVEHKVDDTEDRIKNELEPMLRRQSQSFPPEQYKNLEAAVERLVNSTKFQLWGLTLNRVHVLIESSKELSDIQRERLPQQAVHDADLPALGRIDVFKASVVIAYEAVDSQQLSKSSLVETEELAWRDLLISLKSESRKHAIGSVDEAELKAQNMADRFVTDNRESFGIRLIKVRVGLDLDAKTRANALEKARLEDEVALIELRGKVERASRNEKGERIAFYRDLLGGTAPGREAMFAMMLANNPDDLGSVLGKLDTNDTQRYERLLQMIGIANAPNKLLETDAANIIKDIFNVAMKNTSGIGNTPLSLPHQPSRIKAPKEPSGSASSDSSSQNTNNNDDAIEGEVIVLRDEDDENISTTNETNDSSEPPLTFNKI